MAVGTTPSADQDRLDGLTVDAGDWWFNLRPSNTEPLLRLNLEAAHPDDVRPPRRRGPRPLGSTERHRRTSEELSMALDPQLLEILACPEDKGPLLYFADEDIRSTTPGSTAATSSATTSRSC